MNSAVSDTDLDAGRRASEEGSTTVWFAGAIAALVMIASVFISAGAIFAARAQLQATANLAALAAADTAPISALLIGSETSGCFMAEQVAQANGATLADCFHQGFDSFVVATSSVRVGGVPLKVQARARAGPPFEGIEQLQNP